MNFIEFTPTSMSIDKINIDPSIIILHDHMPPYDAPYDQTFEIQKRNGYGKNTFVDLFSKLNIDYQSKIVISDCYQHFDNFDIFSYSDFLIQTCNAYKNNIPKYQPQWNKKIAVNCLMNKLRESRILASNWLSQNDINIIYTQNWSLEDSIMKLKSLLDLEELPYSTTQLPYKFHDQYSSIIDNYNSNANNFKKTVYPLIENSAISIVLEPIFWENATTITEKYINAVYGFTIPIVNGYKVRHCLNCLGFDTFDDIINYNYETNQNPILRIFQMLNDNHTLMINAQELINKKSIQNRLVYNFELSRNFETLKHNSIFNLNNVNHQRFDEFLKIIDTVF